MKRAWSGPIVVLVAAVTSAGAVAGGLAWLSALREPEPALSVDLTREPIMAVRKAAPPVPAPPSSPRARPTLTATAPQRGSAPAPRGSAPAPRGSVVSARRSAPAPAPLPRRQWSSIAIATRPVRGDDAVVTGGPFFALELRRKLAQAGVDTGHLGIRVLRDRIVLSGWVMGADQHMKAVHAVGAFSPQQLRLDDRLSESRPVPPSRR